MKTLWKNRIAMLIVAAEIIVGLFAGSAFACPRGGGGYSSHARRSYPVKKLHVHRNTPVTPVAVRPVVARPVAAPVIAPVSYVQPQPQPTAPAQIAKFPLEMVDFRLVDLGNAEAGHGPRFRVVLKNITPYALNRPFEVMVSASISEQFSAESPTAVTPVNELAPGQITAVDLRLPIEAMAMSYPGRQEPAPFSMLSVLVAGPKNALGSSTVTNLAVVPVSEVRPVDMAVATPENANAAVGLPLELRGEGFGTQAGQVVLSIAGLKLNVEVLGWSELGIAVRLPQLALTAPTAIQVLVTRADGQVAAPVTLTAVLPSPDATVEEVPFPQPAPQNAAPQAPAESPASLPANDRMPSGGVADADTTSALSDALSLAQAFGSFNGSGKNEAAE